MEPEKLDFYEHLDERSLLARTGRSRASSAKKDISRTEWEKMNGEVITVKAPLPNLPTLSERIKYLMGGMGQREFAKKIFYSQHSVSYWTRGKSVPSDDALRNIARFCEVPLEWLKGNEQPKTTQAAQSHAEADESIVNEKPDKPIEPEKPEKKPVAFAMTCAGKMCGAELKGYFAGLRDDADYDVMLTVVKVGESV